ncbi:hypothetical protein Taro_052451 [Colocasia esculenta]|uniref:Uncharacterized protein n=1 Tax=Colocasia esculenta TaxID=4460 RepID=A0A843XJE2_COLES|nr:hypothetical protein [Colocasia esculenta]
MAQTPVLLAQMAHNPQLLLVPLLMALMALPFAQSSFTTDGNNTLDTTRSSFTTKGNSTLDTTRSSFTTEGKQHKENGMRSSP